MGVQPLPTTALRWHCDADALPFDSTREVDPIPGVIGQEIAVEALEFGLETNAPGQNVFVRGLSGTGRMTLVKRLLAKIRRECSPANFTASTTSAVPEQRAIRAGRRSIIAFQMLRASS